MKPGRQSAILEIISEKDIETQNQLMQELARDGRYAVSEAVLQRLQQHFVAGCADDRETAETIADTFSKFNYLCDPHTAVAVKVYTDYYRQTGDLTKTVIVSTASPYKFTRSVMKAIDEKYDHMSDFDLVDRLSEISGTAVPRAIEEIRTAPVLHDHVCDKTEMKQTVLEFLGI